MSRDTKFFGKRGSELFIELFSWGERRIREPNSKKSRENTRTVLGQDVSGIVRVGPSAWSVAAPIV